MTTKKILLDTCWKDDKEDFTGHISKGQQRRTYWTHVGRTIKKTLLDIYWNDDKEDLTGHMLEGR